MDLSIIIPVHNAEDWISDALNSCMRQKLESMEVIVVDDGSTDNSYSISSSFIEPNMRRLQVIRTRNKGASAARNVGMDAATGEYVMFLDADDWLTENALETLVSIAKKTGADAAIGAHSNFDQYSGLETVVQPKLIYRDAYANAVRSGGIQGSTLMRNTHLRWNEERLIWEGLEYVLDFLTRFPKAVYAERVVVNVRQHSKQSRLSNRFDHFEPATTGLFFLEQKAKLRKANGLNLERSSALDFRILGNAYALLRAGRPDEAEALLKEVSWSDAINYEWYRSGSLVWAGYCFGPAFGPRMFYQLNKLLGRT